MPLRISSWVVIHLLETIFSGSLDTFNRWRRNATLGDYAIIGMFSLALMGLILLVLQS